MTFPLEKVDHVAMMPPGMKAVDSFRRWVISARSIPFGMNVVGVIRYQFLILSPKVYGLIRPLHIPSNVIGVAPSSSDNPGESLNFTVLTVKSAGVPGPAAFPEILLIDTLIRSTSGISSLAI